MINKDNIKTGIVLTIAGLVIKLAWTWIGQVNTLLDTPFVKQEQIWNMRAEIDELISDAFTEYEDFEENHRAAWHELNEIRQHLNLPIIKEP